MGVASAPHYCPCCRKAVMAFRITPNHVLHALLTAGTAGLWLPIWIGVTVVRIGRFRCLKCGWTFPLRVDG
jgi:hypothetical protein